VGFGSWHNKLFNGEFMKSSFLLIAIASYALAQAPPAAPAAPQGAAAPLKDGLYAIMTTGSGVIKLQLFEKETPNTVRNFVGLAKGTKAWKDPKTGALVHKPLYNNITFHRVMLDGMIQGGDPTGKGDHQCGITIKDEIVPTLKFDQPGRLAMANLGSPNTGGCQWFITQAGKIPQYDGGYTIFGQVVEGQDVVKQISRVPVKHDGSGLAVTPVKLISVEIQRVGPDPNPPATKKAAPAPKKTVAK
jgi:peptidyl-prolyl cis-trans isomerase A (cyclophilin A)